MLTTMPATLPMTITDKRVTGYNTAVSCAKNTAMCVCDITLQCIVKSTFVYLLFDFPACLAFY